MIPNRQLSLTGESTDHQYTGAETLGCKCNHASFRCDGGNTLALVCGLAHERDDAVSRMRDNSADNTSEVTRSESNTKLSSLGICFFGLREDVSVKELDNLFKEEEFGHGIRDLLKTMSDVRSENSTKLLT